MSLVSQSGGGRQEEGTRYYGEDEWEAEEGEGVVGEGAAVPGCYCALGGLGAELFGLEGWHAWTRW